MLVSSATHQKIYLHLKAGCFHYSPRQYFKPNNAIPLQANFALIS